MNGIPLCWHSLLKGWLSLSLQWRQPFLACVSSLLWSSIWKSYALPTQLPKRIWEWSQNQTKASGPMPDYNAAYHPAWWRKSSLRPIHYLNILAQAALLIPWHTISCPDCTPSRCFRLMPKTSISPEAGFTDTGVLKKLISSIAKEMIPDTALLLLPTAILLPPGPKSEKIILNILGLRLVVLSPSSYFLSLQMSPCLLWFPGTISIGWRDHDRHGCNYPWIENYASRSLLYLDQLLFCGLTFSIFVNMLYSRTLT